jgi:FkbM family methyltransferase
MMKSFFRNLLRLTGFDIVRFNKKSLEKGSQYRPTGRMDFLLQDLKARGLKCKDILDVGANNGDWSRMASEIFPGSIFYLIEPQQEMEASLSDFCQKHPGSSYFLAGAGSKKEKLFLTLWEDLSGSSFLPEKDDKLLERGKQREVPVLRIDDLIASGQMKMPELIKLDIQGFELEALKGAESTFGKTEVYILEVSLYNYNINCLPEFSDVISFMRERNYVVYDFPGFLRRPVDGALGQCDICFVKKEGFLRLARSWNEI